MSAFKDVFCEAESKAMDFLVSKYAFRVANKEVIDKTGTMNVVGIITYVETLPANKSSNDERFVTLSVAPLRLELDLDFGIGNRKNFFTIYELHRLAGDGSFPQRQHDLYEAMHDTAQLLAEFKRLTDVFQNCGHRFFAGDKSLWDDLKQQRLSETQTRTDILASRNAEKAFKAKLWEKAASFLEPRENRLNEIDAARLKYARKQLRK
jgi:hypothetical protein